MELLPLKFDTWNQFWVHIITTPGYSEVHQIIKFNGVEYKADEIKVRCFNELRFILPMDKSRIINAYEDLSYQLLDSSEYDWMSRLYHTL